MEVEVELGRLWPEPVATAEFRLYVTLLPSPPLEGGDTARSDAKTGRPVWELDDRDPLDGTGVDEPGLELLLSAELEGEPFPTEFDGVLDGNMLEPGLLLLPPPGFPLGGGGGGGGGGGAEGGGVWVDGGGTLDAGGGAGLLFPWTIGERIGARIGMEGSGKGKLTRAGSRSSRTIFAKSRPTRIWGNDWRIFVQSYYD
jgi:hypothetical protein